jgi:NAD+ synthase
VIALGAGALEIDPEATAHAIADSLVRTVARTLNRRGAVVALSGGVDSATCLALAARALGPERVFGLLLPAADSDPGSTERAGSLCRQLGVPYTLEDISPILIALGCDARRDQAIRKVFPDYGPGYRSKIALAEGLVERDRISYFNLIVESPSGERRSERMPPDVYLAIVAATNMKQRTRTLLAYFHAERLNYAVLGTPNRLEYELGFFVRGGDGLADAKPIAHLYKTQVYALAAHLGVPDEILGQTPTTDTYSLHQTQEEFYFGMPLDRLDLLLFAYRNGVKEADAGQALGMTGDQVKRIYRDIEAKRRAAVRGLRDAVLVEDVNLAPET